MQNKQKDEELTVIHGVGLVFINQNNQILTLRELQSKPLIEKEAGMISFPLETVEDGESFYDALLRLLKEEIGIVLEQIILSEEHYSFTHKFETCEVFYQIYTATCNECITCDPEDGDIEFYDWLLPIELIGLPHTRIEVGLFLEKCL